MQLLVSIMIMETYEFVNQCEDSKVNKVSDKLFSCDLRTLGNKNHIKKGQSV